MISNSTKTTLLLLPTLLWVRNSVEVSFFSMVAGIQRYFPHKTNDFEEDTEVTKVGNHIHGANKIESGRRVNLIIWTSDKPY